MLLSIFIYTAYVYICIYIFFLLHNAFKMQLTCWKNMHTLILESEKLRNTKVIGVKLDFSCHFCG